MKRTINIIIMAVVTCSLLAIVSGCKKDQSDYSKLAPQTPAVRLVVPLNDKGQEDPKMKPIPVGTSIRVHGVFLYNVSKIVLGDKEVEKRGNDLTVLHFDVPSLSLENSPETVKLEFYGAAEGYEEELIYNTELEIAE